MITDKEMQELRELQQCGIISDDEFERKMEEARKQEEKSRERFVVN